MKAVVIDNLPRTSRVFELVVERNGIDFTPGDSISIFSQDESESRPYSLTSGADESVLRFIIQTLPGGEVSTYLSQRRPGDIVTLSDPFGWFHPGRNLNGDPMVFIATGTGIAPFLSYFRTYPERPPVMCLFGVREMADAFDLDLLLHACPLQLAVSRENGHSHHCGRVTDLLSRIPIEPETHFYLCGLDAMIDEVTEKLEAMDVDFVRIHREVFFHAAP